MATRPLLCVLYVVLALIAHAHSCPGSDIDNATRPCPSQCVCRWKTGCVQCSALTAIPQESLIPESVKELVLTGNKIVTLTDESFQNFPNLETLSFSSNMIQNIDDATFSGLDLLYEIDLSHNRIVHIGKQFSNLNSLHTLTLDHNQITTIPSGSFTNLPSLKTLLLSNNYMHELGATCFVNLTALSHIELISNLLDSVPVQALRDLTQLQTLILDSNNIRVLPAEIFKYLPALQYLSLKYNHLNTIELNAFVGGIEKNLLSLSLTGNRFNNVPTSALSKLSGLRELFLEENWITEIGANAFSGLVNLHTLYLSDQTMLHYVDVDAFVGLKYLTTILLNTNEHLRTINKNVFQNLFRLHTVCLKGTAIETFPPELMDWDRLPDVDFRSHHLRCDCNLRWMVETTYLRNGSAKTQNYFRKLVCASPSNLKSQKIFSLKPSDFKCEDIHQTGSRLTMGAIVASVTLLCLVLVLVCFTYRRRVMLKLRGYFQYKRYTDHDDALYTVSNDQVEIDEHLILDT